MFLLLPIMLSGALGQQTQFLLPLVSQNQQSQNASVFTLRSQKASVSEQVQIQSRQRNFRKNLLASIYGHRQQNQILKRTSPVSHMNNEQMLRHRDLPIASTAHQKVVNETYKIDASKHRPFPNSNPSQLLHQSFPISQNRTSSNSEIPPQINHHHYTSSGSQPDKRPAELGVGSNVRQRQGHLMEVANLKLAFVQTKVPASITSNKQLRNTTREQDDQPTGQSRAFKVPQLPILAIVTPKPSGATQQFVPQRLPHSNTFDRTIIEPLLATQTTLQPNHASLTRQNQFSTAANDIEKILLSTNDAFLSCCKEKNVDAKCESRCNFDILDRRVLTAMFVGSDPCPRSNGRRLLSCAAQDSDHTNCCRASGVQQTAAGDKCLGFCQMTPESKFQADVSMLPCWGVLKEIKQCFRLSLIEKHNIDKAA